MGIIFEKLLHIFWLLNSNFCSKCPNFIPNVLNFRTIWEVSYFQLKKEEEYIDSTQIGKMSKLDFWIDFFAFKHTNLLQAEEAEKNQKPWRFQFF
jgi:hypothetical protein